MDLGTIIMNLESREYETYHDLLRDVALVISIIYIYIYKKNLIGMEKLSIF